MRDPRRNGDAIAGKGYGVLAGGFFLLLLLGVCLPGTAARAGEAGANDQIVLAALGGVQPLPIGDMAKETARGFAVPGQSAMPMPMTAPSVRLWDDTGAFSPSSIGNTIVTISTGGASQ